ncbi:hypothetical protein GG344DRAFT_61792 [Lentinula edodes]|nr:hypothetical protein GG344DRAFT_61792 [Lentinula edodes]
MNFHSTNAWKDAVLDRMKFTNIPDAYQAPAHDTVLFVGEEIVLNTLRRKYATFPQKYSPLRKNFVVVRRTASMGLGAFAKRRFKVGDTVITASCPELLRESTTVYHFDEATFTFNMVATRNIKAGEEILTMYCGLQVPKAERHRNLLPYGIDPCRCQACETTDQIGSDQRRKSICSFDMIEAKNLPPRDALKELARLVNLIEKEKLHFLDSYAVALHWMAYFWGKLNQKAISQKKLKEAEIYFDIKGKAHSKWLQHRTAIAD